MSPRPYDYESYALTKLSYPGTRAQQAYCDLGYFRPAYINYSNVRRTSPSSTPEPVCSLSMCFDNASLESKGNSQ